jgi:predicted Zn-dependent protease
MASRRSGRAARRAVPAFALLVAALVAGCATTGPRGEQSLIIISTPQEVEIGAGVDQNIRQEFGLLGDAGIQDYVERIGARVAAHADRRDVAYSFTVLDDEVVNAFAAPGGYVYVTTGLLRAARSEAELAGVLGHEVGHVVGRHSVRRLQTAYGVGLAADLVLGDSQTLQAIVGVATNVVLLKNSRDDEFEADEFGLKYAAAAGYDPGQMLSFFHTLLAMQGSPSPAGVAGWFSTHPATEDRIARGEQLLSRYLPAGAQPEIGRERFLGATASLR